MHVAMRVKPWRPQQAVGAMLLVSVLAGACSRGGPDAAGQGPPAMPVKVQTVESTTVQEASEFVGALEADRKVTLRPENEGRVIGVFVNPGDAVRAGDPVVQLRAERSQAEERGAVADVVAARAAVNTANARVSAAAADRDRAAADVRLQESEYTRTATLVAQGALSRQELDRARNSRETAIAALQAAEEDLRAEAASLREAEAQVARAQADRAAVAEDLQDRRVVSPIAGIVGDVPVKLGDLVNTTTTLTSIIQNAALALNLSVPIERSPQLRVGVPVELLDAQNQPRLRGRISFVSPEVTAGEQSVLAKASFTNDGSLRDGQLVRTRVIWSSRPGVLVPSTAVTRIAGQTFVYVAAAPDPATASPGAEAASSAPAAGQPAADQQVARQRLVTLGSLQGNSYQVISGLKPGEEVVVEGVLNLSDGTPIMNAQAMQQPPQGQPQ